MVQQSRQSGLLTLTIGDAEEYFKTEPELGYVQQSQAITLCGIQWHLEAYREMSEGIPWLRVDVESRRTGLDKDRNDKWKCYATCVVRLHRSQTDDETQAISGEFDHDRGIRGTVDFMTIRSLLDPSNGYLKNGKITITCSITASLPPQCEALNGLSGEKHRCTDVKIIVGDRHVYVNKGIMAVSCEYFEAEFYGDFAGHNKDEVHLEGVDFDDFTKFVKAVYPPHDIDGDNIAAVMPLADRFGAKFVLGKCEHFMFDEMETIDAILILDKCGDLSDLEQQLLEDAPRSVLLELADEEMLETLSRDTMAMILKEYRRRLSQP